jgi:hypothetical protein
VVLGFWVVAGATSTRASSGVSVIVRPTSGPATGVGNGAQSGSVPAATRVPEIDVPSAAVTRICGSKAPPVA